MGCYNAAVIGASAETVWAALRNFHDGSWSANVIETMEKIGDAGASEVGARRVLNNAFHETLRSLDDEGMVLTYSLDDGPGPVARGAVSDFLGKVQVIGMTVPDSASCAVIWTSTWGTGTGVGEFCDPIYRALLGDMQAHFG